MRTPISVFIVLLQLVLFTNNAHGQEDLSLNAMNTTWQSSLTNPAMTGGNKKLVVMLPSVYFNIGSPDFTINNISTPRGTGRVIYVDSAITKLKDLSNFNMNVQLQTLGVAFKVKKWNISLYHQVKIDADAAMPKQLVQVLNNGNAQFAGQTISIGLGSDVNAYSELGVGGAYAFNPALTVGARVKFLSGIAGAFTTGRKVDITTAGSNYQLDFATDYGVKTYNLTALSNLNNNFGNTLSTIFSQNSGMSFDLGATLKVGKLEIGLSAIDLGGSITWKENAKNYASKGSYSYTGTTLTDINKFFDVSAYNSSTFYQDTLKKALNIVESSESYTYTLPTKFYLTAGYKVSEEFRLGAILYTQTSSNGLTSATDVAVTASYKLAKFITLGGVWANRSGSFSNLGANMVLKLGPVQIYALTDNIITAFSPYDAKSANGRVGLNLVF
jgi:hypothetical protein